MSYWLTDALRLLISAGRAKLLIAPTINNKPAPLQKF